MRAATDGDGADARVGEPGRRLVDFWFGPLPQRSMALCRIVFGGVVFLAYANLTPHFSVLFGDSGIAGRHFRERMGVPASAFPSAVYENFTWLAGLPDLAVRCLFGLLLLAALAFAIGFHTRLSGCAMVALHLLFQARFEYAFFGWAMILPPLAAYVVASPASRGWSVDARWRRIPAPVVAQAFPLRLLQIHCICIYATVVFARLGTPYWMDGSALYRILSDRTVSRFPEAWRALRQPLVPLGVGALVLEAFAVLLLWRGRVSRIVALGLMAMHLGLEALAMVGWWSAIQLVMLCTFLERDPGALGGTRRAESLLERASPAPSRSRARAAGVRAVSLGLTAYVALLAVGTLRWTPWPRSLEAGRALSLRAERLLAQVGVLPGIALLYDPTNTPMFRRGNCVTIEMSSADGASRVERHPEAHCDGRATPLELPKVATSLILILYDVLDSHAAQVTWRLPTRGPLRLAAITDYYCQKAPGSSPATVRLTWQEDVENIETGRSSQQTTLDATWDCQQHHFSEMAWAGGPAAIHEPPPP